MKKISRGQKAVLWPKMFLPNQENVVNFDMFLYHIFYKVVQQHYLHTPQIRTCNIYKNNSCLRIDFGTSSPYPTVVMVTMDHQNAPGILVNLVPATPSSA